MSFIVKHSNTGSTGSKLSAHLQTFLETIRNKSDTRSDVYLPSPSSQMLVNISLYFIVPTTQSGL